MVDYQNNKLYNPDLPTIGSEYSIAPEIEYLPNDFYQKWTKVSRLQTMVLSGTATPNEFEQWEKSLSRGVDAFAAIESYCRARLSEIRALNRAFPSLSAFSVIAAFIGFLASVAISRNHYIRQKFVAGGSKRYKEDRVGDEVQFRCFVRRFMLGEKHYVKRSGTNGSDKGIDWVLYKIVRCGLVHRYSLSNTRKNADQERLFDVCITHSNVECDICELDRMLLARNKHKRIQVKISASSLCDWMESGMERMFDKGTPKGFKHSLLVNFRKSTPVAFISTH